jgi:hypothetical protein
MQVAGQAPPELGMAGSVSRMRKILCGKGYTEASECNQRMQWQGPGASKRTKGRCSLHKHANIYNQTAVPIKRTSRQLRLRS